MNRALRFTLLALAVVVVLLAVGCGGEGEGGSLAPITRLTPVTRSEAEVLVAKEAGYEVDVPCVQIEAEPPGESLVRQWWKCEPDDPHDRYWRKRGYVMAECWATTRGASQGTDAYPASTYPSSSLPRACPGNHAYVPEPAASPTPTYDTEPYSPESDLAAIELGHRPDSSDSTLLLISSLLNTIESDCPSNTRRQLADFTANSKQLLGDAGIDATPTEILVDVAKSTDLRAFSNCISVFTLYVSLRSGGG